MSCRKPDPRVSLALPAGFAALLLVLGAARAAAMPSFARKYEISCKVCHRVAFPTLNVFGRLYKENGYQLPTGRRGTLGGAAV